MKQTLVPRADDERATPQLGLIACATALKRGPRNAWVDLRRRISAVNRIAFGEDVAELVQCEIAEISQILGTFGDSVQDGRTETEIDSRRVGKNLVLELVGEPHSAPVQKDVCDLVGKNRSNGLWHRTILRLQLDEELVRGG
jgi:hypothetical protein